MLKGGLYQPSFEHDSCGFGLMANMGDKASHWLVHTAIKSLSRLTHRGAIAADGKSGDGCGLLFKMPDAFFREIASEIGITLESLYAVGMVFLSWDETLANRARHRLETELLAEGLTISGWRRVPTDTTACGEEALKSRPRIEQIFINAPEQIDEASFERRLFVARKRSQKSILTKDDVFYVSSLSSRLISYKGLVMPHNLPLFYPDLGDERLASSIIVFHQRFSTNTLPQWRLAQPFRYLAHNGEINTIQGNRNWSQARAHKLKTSLLPNLEEIKPLVSMTGSDSNSLDNMLEVLLNGGMDIFRAMRLLVPRAWQNSRTMDPDLKAFYEYNSMHMEPWDGPAGIVLTDGRYAACAMDRNGLRPARYVITKDQHITLASEIGVYDYAPGDVLVKGRLRPGDMIAVDTTSGELLLPETIDDKLKSRQPYHIWLKQNKVCIESSLEEEEACSIVMPDNELKTYQKLFGISSEELDQVIRVLAQEGKEAIGSMGDDTPLAVFSLATRSLFDYFRQQFAQVTNPPIDPIREKIVMSLETCFGREKNLFEETPQLASRLVVDSPVLSVSKFNQLVAQTDQQYLHERIELGYDFSYGLRNAIVNISDQAVSAIKSGKTILVLSDRGIKPDQLIVHALLATGAVHHRLISEGMRCNANIIVETGTARDPHHFAVLLGFGATAVFPYLAYDCLCHIIAQGQISNTNIVQVVQNYRKGINNGLYKILSKMGISSITSYRGAQLFEIIGLKSDVVDLCFTGTTCRIEGAGFNEIEHDHARLAKQAWSKHKNIHQGGLHKYVYGEECHAYSPDVVHALHVAVRSADYNDYKIYASIINKRPVTVIRDLFAPRDNLPGVQLNEVEPIEKIFARFETGAMSLGALSPEAHETLAEAMNRLGGRSNSGEGGEDPERFNTDRESKIKQVASGRFGVTPHYLVNAEVLQIKIAQGAKPGEGGQLAADKVDKYIAHLRFAVPGTTLISPPPHHDIYSIEDLAQLIFDLKQVNPSALVSVKLASEAGVGTIAAGVAKAYADLITIAGHDGGTGASPITSVKYAGSPWELGLAETHQILRANDLRDRVRLQVDGGIKSGLDVIKGAILGAESFGFGTAPLIAMGCKYLRICHLNNCATGVATQNDVLRMRHFIGDVEMVMNFFRFIAQETREWMALLGIRRFEQLIGRTDLLKILQGSTTKQQGLDLSPILSSAGIPVDKPHYVEVPRNMPFDKAQLAETMVGDILSAIENRTGGEFYYSLRNDNRSIGARLSGEIAARYGNHGMGSAPIVLRLSGTAGQSFGVWNAGGLHLYLEGDANDYVGKGMAGGKIVIYPPHDASYLSHENTIIGNTCLYGATGGKLYAAGISGERFAVRNSGALAVVEGAGDHCCEYMTQGVVTVLGNVGYNFGAGMTGGFAFVLDTENTFVDHYNHEFIDIHRVDTEETEAHRNYLRHLIEDYAAETGSQRAETILKQFERYVAYFWLIKPKAINLRAVVDAMKRAA